MDRASEPGTAVVPTAALTPQPVQAQFRLRPMNRFHPTLSLRSAFPFRPTDRTWPTLAVIG
jgi:hypothetical protein